MGEKKRIVLDTNIWISIFFNKVLAREFEDLLSNERIEIFISEEILREISRVLEYPKIKNVLEKSRISSREVLEEILGISKIVEPREKLDVINEDPEDNKFLECAVGCGAEYIVSGDRHLLKLGKFREIKILPAREFLNMMTSSF